MQKLSSVLSNVTTRLTVIFMWMIAWSGLTCAASLAYASTDHLGYCLLAAGICTLFSVLGHLAAEFPRGNEFMMTRLAMGVAFRTGLPIVILVLLKLLVPELFKGAFVFYVAWFYFVGLIIDLGLQLWVVVNSEQAIDMSKKNCQGVTGRENNGAA